MRKVIVSDNVRIKLEKLEHYLIDEMKFSEEAALKRSQCMRIFVEDLGFPADYALCRFKKWQELGYRCAVFEKIWVFAYEIFDNGIIVRDMSHASLLTK